MKQFDEIKKEEIPALIHKVVQQVEQVKPVRLLKLPEDVADQLMFHSKMPLHLPQLINGVNELLQEQKLYLFSKVGNHFTKLDRKQIDEDDFKDFHLFVSTQRSLK